MPFAPGTPKPANSGRKKGSPNRTSVRLMLQDLGCNSVKELLSIARRKKTSDQLRARIFTELLQYEFPKLRSVEISGPDGGPIQTEDVNPTELFESRMAQLAARLNPEGSTEEPEPQPD